MIDTEKVSTRLRAKIIDPKGKRLLISRVEGSKQEADLSVPPNCDGFGRVHHFRFETSPGWPDNPLPIVPASKSLGLPIGGMMTAQVFQIAACNWRCWYCFVPYDLLSANSKRAKWLSSTELVNLFSTENDRPKIIDLSGGSPDLVPEWTPWMMEALTEEGMQAETYLWSDDNLSTEYFFEILSGMDLEKLQSYKNYGRVCCFKGFSGESFAFNTNASIDDFNRQFTILDRLLGMDLDIYGYVTLTSPQKKGIRDNMRRFIDRLQEIDPNFPLRMVPLEIRPFTPVINRMDDLRRESMKIQWEAIGNWIDELETRFTPEMRSMMISEVPLKR